MLLNIIVYIINSIIPPLIEGYLIITLSLRFLEKRVENNNIYVLGIIVQAMAIETISSLYDSKTVLQLLFLRVIVLMIIHVLFKGSIFKKFLTLIIFELIIMVGEIIALFILIGTTGLDITIIDESTYFYSLGVLISKPIQVLLIKLIISKIKMNELEISNKYKTSIVGLYLIYFVSVATFTQLFFFNSYKQKFLDFSSGIILMIINMLVAILVIYIFDRILRHSKRQIEQQQLLEQYELEHKYTLELNNILDNLRILKHDLKNHISCMWGLVETDNIEDFKLYLTNLSEEIEGLDENVIEH